MNFSRSLSRNWILVAIVVAFLTVLVRAQQPPSGQQQAPPPPAAQEAPPPGQQGPPPPSQPAQIVRQIEIQYAGPATLSRQRILSNLKTTVGQPYSEQTVEDDVRALYATGLVTNVRIYG
ncbi:MAG TPA: POTRA domain-containing protein, partial [Chthoniobacterales bacterium]